VALDAIRYSAQHAACGSQEYGTTCPPLLLVLGSAAATGTATGQDRERQRST
jgi:hypothetical protein